METKILQELKRRVNKLQGYKSTTHIEIASFSWSSKLNSSQASADIHNHLCAPGLKWPWVQTTAASHSYLLTGLWHGPGPARLQARYRPASSNPQSSPQCTPHLHTRDSPKGTGALQVSCAAPSTAPSAVGCVHWEQPPGKQSGWREHNWKGTDTIRAALPSQRRTSQKFSVWWEAQFRNEA